MKLSNSKEIIAVCQAQNLSLSAFALIDESEKTGRSPEDIRAYLSDVLSVMFAAVDTGLNGDGSRFKAKIIKRDSVRLKRRYDTEKPVCGKTIATAASYALATMEVNASMGKIVASPTAGACGVLPAVLATLKERFELAEPTLIDGLLAANVIGELVAKNATISGAEGGCQAEVGTASAMAAAASVHMLGGSAESAFSAAAMAFKNLLGLVCDPIAGLVESPCAKRNAMGAANALMCAELALAGIDSVVPFDEVVDAMYRIGKSLHPALRETALGGLATTPTAIQIQTDLAIKI
jgi:L-serine dehydratase